MKQMTDVDPRAMLVVEAFMERRIDHDELVEWAEALDLTSEESRKRLRSPETTSGRRSCRGPTAARAA